MSIFATKTCNSARIMAAALLAALPVAGLQAYAGVPSDNEEGRKLLDAGATLCFGQENKSESPLALHNWQEYEPKAGEPLFGLLAYWKSRATLQNVELAQYQLHKGMIGQHEAYMLMTALEGAGGIEALSCYALIPGDKALISHSALEAWTGKKPTQILASVPANETRWGVTSPRGESFDISTSFIDPAVAVPAHTKTLPFHGTIIQFGTSENTKL